MSTDSPGPVTRNDDILRIGGNEVESFREFTEEGEEVQIKQLSKLWTSQFIATQNCLKLIHYQ